MRSTNTMTRWTADDIPSQAGRTFIVTGANSGLGYVTTRELARHGAHVIMTARDQTKGERAIEQLRAGRPDASLELRRLDLSDLESVKTFAQGFELQFGTNHLGHFALTGLLLDRLRARRDSRVVTVSSTAHKSGFIHFDDLTGARKYARWAFYAQSKFANTVFGLELDRRLRAGGMPVKSILAHPGYSATNLQTSGPTGALNLMMRVSNRFIAQDVEIGVLSQLNAATDPKVEGGQFIGPDGLAESWGYPTIVQPIDAARVPETTQRLWQISEELTGVRFDLAGAWASAPGTRDPGPLAA